MDFNTNDLIKIANMEMPYGKYKGYKLIDLPERYVVWYNTQELPKGELGSLLKQLYEIKLNGLEYLFKPLRGVNITKKPLKRRGTSKLASIKSNHKPHNRLLNLNRCKESISNSNSRTLGNQTKLAF